MTKRKEEKEKEKQPLEKMVYNNSVNKYEIIARCISKSRYLVKHNEDHLNLHQVLDKAIENVYVKEYASKLE